MGSRQDGCLHSRCRCQERDDDCGTGCYCCRCLPQWRVRFSGKVDGRRWRLASRCRRVLRPFHFALSSCRVGSIFPRLDLEGRRKSVLFYGDIDCYPSAGAFLWDVERADLREELAGQIYVNSKIAKRKMALNRWFLFFLLLFMLLCAVVVVIGSGR